MSKRPAMYEAIRASGPYIERRSTSSRVALTWTRAPWSMLERTEKAAERGVLDSRARLFTCRPALGTDVAAPPRCQAGARLTKRAEGISVTTPRDRGG